jgi:hypothetical protein
MDRECQLLEKKFLAMQGDMKYVYIGDLNTEKRICLLLQLYEKAPIVDDTIIHDDLLPLMASRVIGEYIGYWCGKRLDVSLVGDYTLSTIYDAYTQEGTFQRFVDMCR